MALQYRGVTVLTLALVILEFNTVCVTPTGFESAQEPQVAIAADNRVYVAYGQTDTLYVSISSDQGSTYSAPIRVAEAGKLSLGMRRGPRIAVHDDVVTITATYGAKGKGQDGDILAFRSTDKGITWARPVHVNDVEGSAREGLHGMAIAPDGTLACAWLDLRTKGTKIYMASSADGGTSWCQNRLVYASPSGTVCQCCHPSLAFDPKGKLYVMFRNVLDGARDMYVTSTNDRQTFSPAAKLGQGTWMLDACPMDGGMISVDEKGSLQAIWRREGAIFSSPSSTAEQQLAEGHNPWFAFGSDGEYKIWQTGDNVAIERPDGTPVPMQPGVDPVVTASPDRSVVIAAWTHRGIQSQRLH